MHSHSKNRELPYISKEDAPMRQTRRVPTIASYPLLLSWCAHVQVNTDEELLPNVTILGRDLAHRKQGEMLILALLKLCVYVWVSSRWFCAAALAKDELVDGHSFGRF